VPQNPMFVITSNIRMYFNRDVPVCQPKIKSWKNATKTVDFHLSRRTLRLSNGWKFVQKAPRRIPKIVETLKL